MTNLGREGRDLLAHYGNAATEIIPVLDSRFRVRLAPGPYGGHYDANEDGRKQEDHRAKEHYRGIELHLRLLRRWVASTRGARIARSAGAGPMRARCTRRSHGMSAQTATTSAKSRMIGRHLMCHAPPVVCSETTRVTPGSRMLGHYVASPSTGTNVTRPAGSGNGMISCPVPTSSRCCA